MLVVCHLVPSFWIRARFLLHLFPRDDHHHDIFLVRAHGKHGGCYPEEIFRRVHRSRLLRRGLRVGCRDDQERVVKPRTRRLLRFPDRHRVDRFGPDRRGVHRIAVPGRDPLAR